MARPLKFPDVDALQARIDEYFADKGNKPFTLSGLAYHLDTCTETLRAYGEKELFSATIKRARQRVEVDLMQMMLSKDVPTAGCIFQAINNHGMKQKLETDHKSSDGSMTPQPVTVIERTVVAANGTQATDS